MRPGGFFLAIVLAVAVGLSVTEASVRTPFRYLSPKPGAELVSREASIIVRPGLRIDPFELDHILEVNVHGSASGAHRGVLRLSDDQRTCIFDPHRRFRPGERVTVEIRYRPQAEEAVYFTFEFTVSPKREPLRVDPHLHPELERGAPQVQAPRMGFATKAPTRDGHYTPPPDFPHITINEVNDPAPGQIFLTNFSFRNNPPTVNYMMILDNTGFPVFFRHMPYNAVDFKVQPNGLLTYFDLQPDIFFAMDATYSVVDSFMVGNGYTTDLHELLLLPNDHALLMSYDPQPVDMSQVVEGGNPQATVIGLIIQEIDAQKNVVFQWRSWDHFEITDAIAVDLTADEIDYVHGNAIEADHDGHLLISSRHLDEITKIDRQTGEVIWRWGGKKNEFTFVGDTTRFYRQHDIGRLDNGHVTLYDNGNFHAPPYSRAVEYALDEEAKTATLVWQYRNAPDTYGFAMGSARRLPNGNTLIGWGATNPTVTEVRPDGSKAFEMTFDPGIYSYRALRFPWQGVAAVPHLWADTSGQRLTLHFVRFGADDVRAYNIYQGEAPGSLAKVDSTSQTSYVVERVVAGTTYHFQVTAVDAAGEESGFSNRIAVTPDFTTSVSAPEASLPERFVLHQNYPNPFNPSTTIRFDLPVDAHVELKIYNLLGQAVRSLMNKRLAAGEHTVVWDGRDGLGRLLGSGIYVSVLRTDAGVTLTGKMVLVK